MSQIMQPYAYESLDPTKSRKTRAPPLSNLSDHVHVLATSRIRSAPIWAQFLPVYDMSSESKCCHALP
ncbi:hypothetical protein IQ07DRAFT_589666 [Pyrenochaeta sp. DS3sAY3a]|nr:hypothetical protein IQ07DRAFT_589666 [Pyrenochaeta sp. DS3sAY3a]